MEKESEGIEAQIEPSEVEKIATPGKFETNNKGKDIYRRNVWHLSDEARVWDLATVVAYKNARKNDLPAKIILNERPALKSRFANAEIEFNEAQLRKRHIQKIAPSIPDEDIIFVGEDEKKPDKVVQPADILVQKFPRFVKNYNSETKPKQETEQKKPEKSDSQVNKEPIDEGKLIPFPNVEKEDVKTYQEPEVYDLIHQYKSGLQERAVRFREVYWRREAPDGTYYIKRMTPDGKVTVVENDHGKLSENSYHMNTLVVPVPNRLRSILGVFNPKNWKAMRNYEYLEEAYLQVGQMASDGTKVTGINVFKDEVWEDPGGLAEDFEAMRRKAGKIGREFFRRDWSKPPEKILEIESIKPQVEEHTILDDMEVDQSNSDKPDLGSNSSAKQEGSAVEDANIISIHGYEGEEKSNNDAEDKSSSKQEEEEASFKEEEQAEGNTESSEKNDRLITRFIERPDGSWVALNMDEIGYKTLGLRAVKKIALDKSLPVDERRTRILEAYNRKRKSTDPNEILMIMVESSVSS